MLRDNKITFYDNPDREIWNELCKRGGDITDDTIEKRVLEILSNIKDNGDSALEEYVKLFDSPNLNIKGIRATNQEIDNAALNIDSTLKSAIHRAISNVEKFHVAQLNSDIEVETQPGVKCYQKNIPIEKVGIYIPGGTAPLFSTVIMLAIPAKLAGCKEIIMCTPAQKSGDINPVVLYTAKMCGVTQIYKVGGAPAIAAMAYGTTIIPKVDKIFGPGNRYVTTAKQLVSNRFTSIDMPAGPSEILIIADESADPRYVSADFLSQLEHGNDSIAILLTDNKDFANRVSIEFNNQISKLSREDFISNSFKKSKIILFNSREDIFNFSNKFAPEHLIISTKDYKADALKIINAGSVFLGNYSPESAGDYASGTNHTLPTCGWATSFSGVNIFSFLKKITFQEISKEGLKELAKTIIPMAEAEGLDAHKNAVVVRLIE